MGYQDRDYFRDRSSSWYYSISGSACRMLVLINVGVFIAQVLTAPGLHLAPFVGQGFVTDWFAMDPVAVFEHGQFWRPFTSFFLHSPHSIWHILFNMLVLWFFGPDLEERYGSREFLAFYLVAGTLSMFVWGAGVYWLEPSVAGSIDPAREGMKEFVRRFERVAHHHQALGASGAVTAVMVLCAWLNPHRLVIVFIITVPLWLLAVVYVASDFIVLYQRQPTGTAVSAHLTGAAFATLYYHLHWRILGFWRDLTGWLPRWNRPRLRLHRPVEDSEPAPRARPKAPDDFDTRVDAVLAKLNAMGRDKLTPEELEILQQASERYRRRRS